MVICGQNSQEEFKHSCPCSGYLNQQWVKRSRNPVFERILIKNHPQRFYMEWTGPLETSKSLCVSHNMVLGPMVQWQKSEYIKGFSVSHWCSSLRIPWNVQWITNKIVFLISFLIKKIIWKRTFTVPKSSSHHYPINFMFSPLSKNVPQNT